MHNLVKCLGLILFLFSCNGIEKKAPIIINSNTTDTLIIDSTVTNLLEITQNLAFDTIINQMPFKKTPLIDTTNFDNFNATNFFNKSENSTLHLETIYPNYYKEGYNYKTTPSYKIELSDNFYSIVLTTCKGENEMESMLVNYDLEGNIIDFEVISYDEIAEGWSRIESKIEKNQLTITHMLWLDEKQVENELFEINTNGKITPLDN